MATSTLPERATGDLAPDEYLRYSRHLILPEIGVDGQRALRRARVLLVGAGGLGSPAALYLAAAGVGTLGLVDFDHVDVTNLQRQVLHGTRDIGRHKLDSARDRLRDINPGVHVEGFPVRLSADNARELANGFDLTAASIASHRRPDSYRPAPRVACSACYRDWSGPSRRLRRSS
jgi:adenylyltransferase/sulfurtransferase